MIVIFCDNINDFINFLEKRIMNEIFYEVKEIKNEVDLSTKLNSEIVLHYLAKVSNTLVLYETMLKPQRRWPSVAYLGRSRRAPGVRSWRRARLPL